MDLDEIKKIVLAITTLSKEQFQELLVLAAAVAFGAFKLGTFIGAKQNTELDVVPCWRANGYPRGEWMISGVVREKEVPLATSLRFDTSLTGSVMTNEKGGPLGSFSIDHELAPSQSVVYTAKTTTGYLATLKGLVSPCGCYISGDWVDNQGHSGFATYFWRARDRYWVKP